jgi:hypoxanthine phosphoribosyltransferase
MNIETLELLLSKEAIAEKIAQVAKRLDQLYGKDELVIVAVMKGAICLVADLMRALKEPCVMLECVQASSYGSRGEQRGDLTVSSLSPLAITDKHVLLVDDIFDSGHTLHTIAQALQKQHPRSLRTLVLLSKQVPREMAWEPDDVLFSIENRFVVGYGLDYNERYRALNGVYATRKET